MGHVRLMIFVADKPDDAILVVRRKYCTVADKLADQVKKPLAELGGHLPSCLNRQGGTIPSE